MTAPIPNARAALAANPAAARIVPFAVYMAFIVLESLLPEKPGFDLHWLYVAQIVVTAAALAFYWGRYEELRDGRLDLRNVLLGVGTGIVVYVLWKALDQPWAAIGEGRPVETARTLWAGDPLFAVARVLGAAVLVPIMEELFWRSFLMRWAHRTDFLAVAPAQVGLRALAISAVLFGLEHHLIVAGIAAGLVYGELYRRTGRLWTVVIAHAVTNGILELLG